MTSSRRTVSDLSGIMRSNILLWCSSLILVEGRNDWGMKRGNWVQKLTGLRIIACWWLILSIVEFIDCKALKSVLAETCPWQSFEETESDIRNSDIEAQQYQTDCHIQRPDCKGRILHKNNNIKYSSYRYFTFHISQDYPPRALSIMFLTLCWFLFNNLKLSVEGIWECLIRKWLGKRICAKIAMLLRCKFF